MTVFTSCIHQDLSCHVVDFSPTTVDYDFWKPNIVYQMNELYTLFPIEKFISKETRRDV